MRSREEIERASYGKEPKVCGGGTEVTGEVLEVLLDIRDLLIKIEKK